MTEPDKHNQAPNPTQVEKQPPALLGLLSSINAARRQFSLYGTDHPNSLRTAQELSLAIDEFIAAFDRTTFVFARKALIANDRSYATSTDSQEIFHRLRARGVMAITLVGSVGPEQAAAFLAFLNAEPAGIRAVGGASTYLRQHAVSRIVATDAVYTSGDVDEDTETDTTSRADWDSDMMDHAVGAAIDWLSRQDDEAEEAAPRLPISDILSRPDQAAKLIREAVTKLHAARREETTGELASEVVHDLKDLAGSEREKWDNSTPQIRKAISKLPRGFRPEISGFTEEDEQDEVIPEKQSVDIGEIEAKVADVLEDARSGELLQSFPSPDAFGALFGAKADGLLSSWRKELQPGSVMESSGRTLETLMIWESRATEHERIARALAGLIPRAVAMKDTASAVTIAESLIRESSREDPLNWRVSNVKAALAGLDVHVMKGVVESALASGGSAAAGIAARLVATLPDLALESVGLLGSSASAEFSESLRCGISAAGTAAIGPLGKLLATEIGAARDIALEVLIDMNGAAAVRQISQVLPNADSEFVIRALKLLPGVRTPQVVDMCTTMLNHAAPEVRCAALAALGDLGDESTVPGIAQVALRRSLKQDDIAEQLQAIRALGMSDCPEALDCLRKLAHHRPLLGRNRFEGIRLAAERALGEAASRQAKAA